MKKRNSKKGFTLVELVIVIAVIAILAGVLIPTFSGIVTKANQSAVQQEAANIYKEVYALDLSDGVLDGKDAAATDGGKIVVGDKKFIYTVSNGTVTFKYSKNNYLASFEDSKWSVAEHKTHTGEGTCTACGATIE